MSLHWFHSFGLLWCVSSTGRPCSFRFTVVLIRFWCDGLVRFAGSGSAGSTDDRFQLSQLIWFTQLVWFVQLMGFVQFWCVQFAAAHFCVALGSSGLCVLLDPFGAIRVLFYAS